MKYVAGVLAVVVCFYAINSKGASDCMAMVIAKFGPLLGSIVVLAIVGVAFSVMLGGFGAGGGGEGKKKK